MGVHTDAFTTAIEEESAMTDKTESPATDETLAADETFAWTDDTDSAAAGHGSDAKSREWLFQLQSMIENITEQAGPFLRQVSAKAAELAAVAGEKAGPIAARAAEMTAEAGSRLAEKSRDLAADLRRDQAAKAAEAEAEAEAVVDEDAPAS